MPIFSLTIYINKKYFNCMSELKNIYSNISNLSIDCNKFSFILSKLLRPAVNIA